MNSINSPTSRLTEIAADFSFLDNWEDRFRHIIDLGRGLEPLDESEKIDANKVQGCTSQVWLISELDSNTNAVHFRGNSDSTLVQGLLAILIAIYSNSTCQEILELDPREIFETLQLKDSLTPNRSNGLVAMVNKMREFAQSCTD